MAYFWQTQLEHSIDNYKTGNLKRRIGIKKVSKQDEDTGN